MSAPFNCRECGAALDAGVPDLIGWMEAMADHAPDCAPDKEVVA